MKKKILIVGGTGFIGHYLAKKCSKKYNVTCLSLNKLDDKKKLKYVNYICADISKNSSLIKKLNRDFDIVVNLGGYINHSDKNLAIGTHFNGCKNLINFFQKKKIDLFIQIGSSTEYGKQKAPNNENNFGQPKTIYAKSKLNASKYLVNFSKKKNFPFVILRFYQVYGPAQNNNRLIPIVINSALKNLKFKCSSGLQGKDFLYITDAVDAIIKCFRNKNIVGEIINIGSGNSITVKNLILKIVKKINSGKPIFGALEMRSDEPKDSYPSLKKAKKILSWSPKISLDKGLIKTISYYRKNKYEI